LKQITRPDTIKDNENCLNPDIKVYTTGNGILNLEIYLHRKIGVM